MLKKHFTARFRTILAQKSSENTAGKGENAGNQHFFLFLQCFLPHQRKKLKHFNHNEVVVFKCFQFGQFVL